MIHVTRVSNKERERDLIYGGFHTHTHTHTQTQYNNKTLSIPDMIVVL